MSQTVTRHAAARSVNGGVLVAVSSVLAAVLVLLAVFYAAGIGGRLAAARPPARHVSTPAGTYTAIAAAANRQLAADANGYAGSQASDLAAARSQLAAEVATERSFDRRLAVIAFPAGAAAIARALIRADQQRAALTARQARSASLRRLRSYDRRHRDADAAVTAQAVLLRQALHLPPPPQA